MWAIGLGSERPSKTRNLSEASMSEFPGGAGGGFPRPEEERATTQQAKTAVGEVAETVKDQAQTVAGEARQQTRQVVTQLRDRVGEQTRQQSRRAAQGIRQWADDLAAVGDGVKPDSPVGGVVRQVADTGRQ